MKTEYKHPVNKLLELDMTDDTQYNWPDYLEMGFNEDHVPELIRLATDTELHFAEQETPDVWGPIHAWRTLGQLKAEEAIEPLLSLLPIFEEEGSDWAEIEIPMVLELIGLAAIPYMKRYFADPENPDHSRIIVGETLLNFTDNFPEITPDCKSTFVEHLKAYHRNSPLLNGFLIAFLTDLKAVEEAPLIQEAMEADAVDLTVCGDWEDVRIDLGFLDERKTPRSYSIFSEEDKERWNFIRTQPEEDVAREKKKAKKKSKRKMEKASRKKQKKKKKKK